MTRPTHRVSLQAADGELLVEQRFDRKVLALVAALESTSVVLVGGLVFALGVSAWAFVVVLGLSLGVFASLALMRLRVRLEAAAVRWTWWPFMAGRIAFAAIENVEAITVDAMRDFGGWGPKYSWRSPRELGLVAQSGGGVRITRRDGKRPLVITCASPERVAAAILKRVVVDHDASTLAPEAFRDEASTANKPAPHDSDDD
jgi:hypothetical protein